MLVDVAKLVTAYHAEVPDPPVPAQRIAFGTSGHRGFALQKTFTHQFGDPAYDRVEAAATPAQKEMLARLSPQQVRSTDLAGESIQSILSHAPGKGAPLGGVKVSAQRGWFTARPSGTESIYKIYAESFRGQDHLRRIVEAAQWIVDDALAGEARPGEGSGKP